MRYSSLALLVVLLTVGCDAIQGLVESPPPPARGLAPATRSNASADAKLLQAATPGEVLERMQARTRLTPDRRFIRALAQLETLVGKPAPAEPSVTFEADAWQVRSGASEFGALPELPGFEPLFELIGARATAVWRESGQTLEGQLEQEPLALTPPWEILPALRAGGAEWAKGQRTTATLRRATLASVLLTVAMVDQLGVGDEVPAHAIAMLALTEAATGAQLTRDRALLARALGYASAAAEIAKSLPEADPVRLYANDDLPKLFALEKDAELMLAASAALDVSSFAGLAPLIGAIEKHGLTSYPQLAVLAFRPGTDDAYLMSLSAGLALRELTGKPAQLPAGLQQRGGGVVQGVIDSIVQLATSSTLPLEQLLPAMEKLVDETRALPGTALLPSNVVANFYSAQFFSGFNDVLRYQLDTRGDTKGAGAHLELMGKPTGALGKQVERYAVDVSAAEQRALPLDTLVKDLTALDQLGPGALKRMTDVVLDQGGYTPQMQLAETALYARCDSRLECRSLLERVADQGTKDLVLGDRLRGSLVAEAPRHFASARLRHALLSRDRVEALSAIGDRSLSISRRAWYLAHWGKWLDDAAVRRAFEGLLAEDPYDHDVREHYGRYLTDRGEQKAALAVFDVYLKQDPSKDAHPLHRLGIRAQKARALQELGRLDEARDLVEPDVRSMYGASLGRTAYVRSARGEHDEAIEMAERRLKRYPGGSSVSLLAQMHWQAGRDDDAAELLEQWSKRLTIDDWQRHLAAAFTDAFEKQPVDRAVAAFAALTKRDVDPMGARLLVQVAGLSPEHKFRALVQLPTSGYRRHHEAGRLYNWMKRWKGEAEAQKFIAEYLPEGTRDPLAQFGYTTRNYDLIWTFVPDLPETHQHVAFLWLMRTASYLRTKERPAEWRAKLDARYADPAARPHPHDQMAMFLLGKLNADTLWKVSDSADHRPEAAWILGLKAELDGDLPTAIHWYRACMQGGRGNSGEVQWSSDSLSRWNDAQKSLSVLAREVNDPEDETL